MSVEILNDAIDSVLESRLAFCKFLSANDTGATGGHQSGILVSKSAKDILFYESLDISPIMKRNVQIHWMDDIVTDSVFTYYKSKNELRITKFGRGFPYLKPDETGSLFVLTLRDDDYYSAFVINTEYEINQFLSTFDISPVQTNALIEQHHLLPEFEEAKAITAFVGTLKEEFPSSKEMSRAARSIQNAVYDQIDLIISNPDQIIIDWTNMEYTLFRTLEQVRYGGIVSAGFDNMDAFVEMANRVLNRRKSRAGKSLENHLEAIFDGNNIEYTSQAITEGNKKPDFLFPSETAYHDFAFPTENLVSLAAKTTCKDRWRQILNEADRLKNGAKYLCTLQQGISPAQMDEMQTEKVILVVPEPLIKTYPKDRQDRIWTLKKFVDYVKEIES